jgi:hypothetical protein
VLSGEHSGLTGLPSPTMTRGFDPSASILQIAVRSSVKRLIDGRAVAQASDGIEGDRSLGRELTRHAVLQVAAEDVLPEVVEQRASPPTSSSGLLPMLPW